MQKRNIIKLRGLNGFECWNIFDFGANWKGVSECDMIHRGGDWMEGETLSSPI